MKRLLFLILILAFVPNIEAATVPTTGFVVNANCANVANPVANSTACLQTTTAGGRSAGQVYVWSGSAWTLITGSGAPVDATYITQTPNSVLTNEQALNTLSSGILKQASGVAATATAGTDYVAPGSITTSGLTQNTARILGRSTASSGAVEEITIGANLTLSSGQLSASGGASGYATIQDEGTPLTQRSTFNCIGSSIVCVDDAGNTRTNMTVTAYNTVADEGTPLTQRPTLNFIGSGITCVDNSGDSRTDCTISGGSSGSLWTVAGPQADLVTAPPTTGWSWDNQSSATATEPTAYSSNQLSLAAGVGSGLSVRYRTAPSVPYTITALLHINGRFGVNFLRLGLLFRQNSDGKIAYGGLRIESSGGILASSKYTNATTFSADYTTLTLGDFSRDIWLRIADNNTNRIISYSWDGINFIVLDTQGRTDFLTADQVGWFIQTEAGAQLDVNLISWVEG